MTRLVYNSNVINGENGGKMIIRGVLMEVLHLEV